MDCDDRQSVKKFAINEYLATLVKKINFS